MWKIVGGWSGHSEHVTYPHWELHTVDADLKTGRYCSLRNTRTGSAVSITGQSGLYRALDIAEEFIQAHECEDQR